MKKYITISILSILLLILLAVVFTLLWQFKANVNFIPQFAKDTNTQPSIQTQNQDLSWQEELAKWPTRDFTPAAEKFTLYFDADTSELKEKNKYYQLIVGKYDIYSMFCLRQTLNSFNVKYFLLKSGDSPEIFLDTGNEKLIDDIIKELKKYKINTEVKEIGYEKKIIVCDAILDKGVDILRKAEDIELIEAAKVPKDELMQMLSDVEVAITRSSTDVDINFLNHAKKLKALVRAGVGVDNVDIPECSKRGVIVMNVPTANTIAAVELTMAHLLTSARSFVNAHNFLKIERKWEREKWYGIELMNKTLGVIGFGNIGSRVAIRAKAFGMKILAYDPYISASKITDLDMEQAKNLDEILEKSDFITIHTPKTKETNGMIGKQEIAKMKDGIRLINCARGGLYTEEALYEGLKSGKIAWLGIDVFDKEPATNHPLLDFENISVTSHLGANTLESQDNIAREACEQALSAARGVAYPNALNLPIKTEDLPPFVAPYIELVSKMAFLAVQIDKNPIKSIKLEAEGIIGEYAILC